ncbi:hypothetical protein WN51_11517 [Melipona quadrifasciata]|uniref:Uncharacterized protein n=1 Tax=Melipona quadrifasciata TaxID=166423 RepID=A0A0M9AAM3_9HYME|nr:hypothetical protein WN51_11517 [Melipona quadrifasciata]
MRIEKVARLSPPLCDAPDTEVFRKVYKQKYLLNEKQLLAENSNDKAGEYEIRGELKNLMRTLKKIELYSTFTRMIRSKNIVNIRDSTWTFETEPSFSCGTPVREASFSFRSNPTDRYEKLTDWHRDQ